MAALDSIDHRILRVLQADARISNKELAARVSLSPSACLMRVRRLESSGLVTGYRARLDLEQIAPCVEVFAEVTLATHKAATFQRFEAEIDALDEVIECHKVSGSCDYLLRFACRDVKRYHRISDRLLERAEVKSLQTLVVLETSKDAAGYPLDRLLERQPGD